MRKYTHINKKPPLTETLRKEVVSVSLCKIEKRHFRLESVIVGYIF